MLRAKDREVSIKLGPAHGWSIVTSTKCNLPPLTKSESRKALNQVESSLSEGCLPMHFTISSCRENDFAESLYHWSFISSSIVSASEPSSLLSCCSNSFRRDGWYNTGQNRGRDR
jgi:hypothetical protein